LGVAPVPVILRVSKPLVRHADAARERDPPVDDQVRALRYQVNLPDKIAKLVR